MEIERKFLVKTMPDDLGRYRRSVIEQAYICREPVIRVRKDNDDYILTCKGRGNGLSREELNLPLSYEAYTGLLAKAEGSVIKKTRYYIPIGDLTAELDIFAGVSDGLALIEVEFSDEKEAASFIPPEWFGKDVTGDPSYYNANMH